MGDVPEGIDREGVTGWLAERTEVSPPLAFGVVEGGRSNLTFVVTDQEGRRWVLRRPPLHSVLPSAHDMSREHTVMSALRASHVPVPTMLGYEDDESVTGAEFYVMDFVPGEVIRDRDAAESVLGPEARRAVSEQLVDVLARLHAVDPDAVGLSEFGRKDGYVARQLRRWHGQLEQGSEREIPLLDEVYERLAAEIPEQGPATIVHGDYRLDNVIVTKDGEIKAVLDWELCTLGDPLADVGLLSVYWSDPGDTTIPLLSAPTAIDGFARRAEVVARYGERSGRDLSQLGYYVAFAFWKLAIILDGVYTRFAKGAYGDLEDREVRRFADLVIELAESADEAARKAGR
ncbi:MAG: phosphotransferase family protein [Nitriliruptorales bacterium]